MKDAVTTIARTRLNRLLAKAVDRVLERSPGLERVTSARTDARRLHITLTKLRRRGLTIETVYDIGAHRGAWTADVRRSLPEAQFFLFEANETHADALAKAGDRFFTVVLSSEEKPVEFFRAGTSGDSYFRELTDRYSDVAPTSVLATTLDHIIDAHGLPYPDLIKLDVQGAELDVLTGGRNALARAKLVVVECPIVPYNLGAPTMDDYFRFMDANGFTPLQFVDEIWPDGRMRHVDVLFGNVEAMESLLS